MKVTDYCPRAAPFDSYLRGSDLTGVEVGVDVGAHAEALLTYCQVAMLHLVDPWPNIERKGYCDGRLSRFRGRYELHQQKSYVAAIEFFNLSCQIANDSGGQPLFDFIYLDQEHDGASVSTDLEAWWPLLRVGGVLGHRNYVEGRGSPLENAVDSFVRKRAIKTKYERYLSDIVLFKH